MFIVRTKFFSHLNYNQFVSRCVYFVVAFFKVLKLLLQMVFSQKLIAFVALMVFASQGAMAAPQYHPALVPRAPQPPFFGPIFHKPGVKPESTWNNDS